MTTLRMSRWIPGIGLVFCSLSALAQISDADFAKVLGTQGKYNSPFNDTSPAISVLGTSTLQSEGNLIGANSASTSTTVKTVEVKLLCGPLRTPYYAEGLTFRTVNCVKQGTNPIMFLKVDVCAHTLSGGECTEANWASSLYHLGPGTGNVIYSTRTTPPVSVELSLTSAICTNTECPAKVTIVSTLAVSAAGFHQAGVAANTANSGINNLAAVLSAPAYQTQLANTVTQFKACQERIHGAVSNNDPISSCDGTSSSYVGTGCTELSRCVASGSSIRDWIEKCQVEVPTVRRDCNTLTPTRTCTVTKPVQVCTLSLATTTCPRGTCTANQMTIRGFSLIYRDATTDYYAQSLTSGTYTCSAPVPDIQGLSAPFPTCSTMVGEKRCTAFYQQHCIKWEEDRACTELATNTCTQVQFPTCVNTFVAATIGTTVPVPSAPRCPTPLGSGANTASCVVSGTPTCREMAGSVCLVEDQQQYCPGLAARTCFSPTPPVEPVVCKPLPEATGCRDRFIRDPVTGVNVPMDPRIAPADGNLNGVCLNSWTSDGCYAGRPELCIQSKPSWETGQTCTLFKQKCVTEILGVCGTVEQEFKCSSTKETCSAYKTELVCNTSLTKGTEIQPVAASSNSFSSAMASMGVVDGVQKALIQGNVTIFDGEPLTCRRPTWILNLDNFIANDCCRRDLEKTDPGKPLHKCSDSEVRMAAGRRANRTHPLGDYCSKRWPLPFGCQERAQVDCVFSSLLAKDIQKGGRDQLGQIAATGSSPPQTNPVFFGYYNTQNTGLWTRVGAVEARPVMVYLWPAYCSSAATEVDFLSRNPNTPLCNSGLTVYFAVCNNERCQEPDKMIRDPRVAMVDWTVLGVDPLIEATTSLATDVSIKGACAPATSTCNYVVSTWPRGGASTAYAQAELVFAVGKGSLDNSVTVGRYKFHPKWAATNVTTWTLLWQETGRPMQSANIPLDIPGPGITLPATNGIQIYGSCHPKTLVCIFQLRLPVVVRPKPWGTPEAPKCAGFTLDEISVIDFSKIDLSEFVATVKATLPEPALVAAEAKRSMESTALLQKNGGNRVELASQQPISMRIIPEEISGCFEKTEPNCTRGRTRVVISGNWPKWPETASTDPSKLDLVTQVVVSWGDGRPQTYATRALGSDVYVAEHSYWEQGKNVQHEIGVNLSTTKSGAQWVRGYVNNFTKNPEKGAGIGSNSTGQVESSYRDNVTTPRVMNPSGVSNRSIPIPNVGP